MSKLSKMQLVLAIKQVKSDVLSGKRGVTAMSAQQRKRMAELKQLRASGDLPAKKVALA